MPVAIGVDVGGTKVLAVAVDTDEPARILTSARLPTPPSGDGLVDTVVRSARSAIDDLGSDAHVAAVGVGLPGLVDADGGLQAAPNLRPGVGIAVRERVGGALDRPVVVANDASAAAWAETVAGAGRGADDIVLVTLGTGIGGGLVSGGRLHGGVHGYAGEPGHMVVDPAGPLCPCGRRGCWERYASGSGLEHLAGLAVERGEGAGLVDPGAPGGPSGERLAALARADEPAALAVFETFSWWLALGIANLVDLLDPELVLVGGGLADVADLYLERTRALTMEMALGASARTRTRIEVATLGSTAGAIGAALLASSAGERRDG